MRTVLFFALFFWLLTSLPPLGLTAAAEGTVTLPVATWNQMQQKLADAATERQPQIKVSPMQREISGSFDQGLLSATLVATFEVLASEAGHIRVPVLDGSASLGEVLLNGQQTSLLREARMYTVGVDRPGIHRLQLQFYWGEQQDRFVRRLRFRVPQGGSTKASVLLPVAGIEAQLAGGAIASQTAGGGKTQLVGYLDGSGDFDLSWTAKLSHSQKLRAKQKARLNTVVTLGEALLQGLAVFDFAISEGETDRFDLRLPAGLEVLEVEGDDVLQWHTESRGNKRGQLSVLLRYLVDEEARVLVKFQQPIDSLDQPVTLLVPLAGQGTPMEGNLGVLGPAGLNVQVAPGLARAKQLTLRDMPPELTSLTTSPLLLGFSFDEAPEVALAISRHQEVELTTTIIDELQASTVVIEDGSVITKLKLRVRNNTLQYLAIAIPGGARLTHSLIDGNAVRPALGEEGNLLFPLRQSERLGAGGERFHYVRQGETLSDVANFHYSAPDAWRRILAANQEQVYAPTDIVPGQRLRIPTDSHVEESSFVIELAYKHQGEPLGTLGRRHLTLPQLAVDVTKVTWHLYFPKNLTALSFDSNLTQYSAIRYDLFRRARDYLRRALVIDDAWAGGRYQSILKRRKGIYQQEFQKKASSSVVLASFPLVGERYRFKHKLLGSETPAIGVTYVARGIGTLCVWLAFIAAFLLTAGILQRPHERFRWIAGGAGLVVLLVLAHYFLGVHRRILWGVDAALLIAWGRLRLPAWWSWLRLRLSEPWLFVSWLRLGNLLLVVALCVLFGIALSLPMLLSTLTGVLLLVSYIRARRREVGHA